MLALAADVEKIRQVMDEYNTLESLLSAEESDTVTHKSIELKASIKKLMTGPEVLNALNRLEVQGEGIVQGCVVDVWSRIRFLSLLFICFETRFQSACKNFDARLCKPNFCCLFVLFRRPLTLPMQ